MNFSSSKLKLLNRGANSEVYLYGTPERGVAIKAVATTSKNECRHLLNQYVLLKSMDHDNVIKALKYQEGTSFNGNHGDKQNQTPRNILILENARHGSLLDFYQKNSQIKIGESRWIFAELCDAIKYLHQKKIAHRDLKLQNILITQNQDRILVKVADFGFASKQSQSSLSKAYKGTKRGYMAPQIHALLDNPQEKYDIFKADIFALGVILFSMVLKRLPFQSAKSENSFYKLIKSKNYESFWKMHLQSLNKVSLEEGNMIEEFKQLFISMVNFNPDDRPIISDIIRCPWMKGRQSIVRSLK